MSRRILIPLLLAALMVPFAVAQDNSGNNQGDRGGDRGRGGPGGSGGGNFDPAAMRQRRMEQIKEQMGVTSDDEWKVITAKLEPVMTKQREVMAGQFGGFGGGRGGRGGDDNRQRTAVEQASRDLRTLLEDKAASEDQIKGKLTAFREARDKARTELVAAQKDLKEILMPRQEAVLVTNGMLE
jgi:Spy/CpxP family protein refolding chaperone